MSANVIAIYLEFAIFSFRFVRLNTYTHIKNQKVVVVVVKEEKEEKENKVLLQLNWQTTAECVVSLFKEVIQFF